MSISSSSLSPTAAGLECPVCLFIPRQEIYQCSNGHSICKNCISKLATCPACRVAFSGPQMGKIRNHYAESLLDAMKFGCIWKAQGCDVLVSRNQLSEHEGVCKYRTLNLCTHFERSKKCKFDFSILGLQIPVKVDQVLAHMKYAHNFYVQNPIQWNRQPAIFNYPFNVLLQTFRKPGLNWCPVFQQVVQNNQQTSSSDLYVLLFNLEEDHQKQMLLSFGFATLHQKKWVQALLLK